MHTTVALFYRGEGFNDSDTFLRLEYGFDQFVEGIDPEDSPFEYLSNGFPDMRGEWVFVTEAGVNGPWRFEFVSAEIEPFDDSENFRVRFGTSSPDVFMECVPSPDQEIVPGCQLYSEGRVLLSANRSDIGAERIYGFRGRLGGELGSDDPGPIRREHRAWGFRLIDRPVPD